MLHMTLHRHVDGMDDGVVWDEIRMLSCGASETRHANEQVPLRAHQHYRHRNLESGAAGKGIGVVRPRRTVLVDWKPWPGHLSICETTPITVSSQTARSAETATGTENRDRCNHSHQGNETVDPVRYSPFRERETLIALDVGYLADARLFHDGLGLFEETLVWHHDPETGLVSRRVWGTAGLSARGGNDDREEMGFESVFVLWAARMAIRLSRKQELLCQVEAQRDGRPNHQIPTKMDRRLGGESRGILRGNGQEMREQVSGSERNHPVRGMGHGGNEGARVGASAQGDGDGVRGVGQHVLDDGVGFCPDHDGTLDLCGGPCREGREGRAGR